MFETRFMKFKTKIEEVNLLVKGIFFFLDCLVLNGWFKFRTKLDLRCLVSF